VFGEKFIDMVFPDGAEGPFLDDGDTIENTLSATEFEDFFAASEPLFDEVDEEELARLVTSIADTVQGEGDNIASAWESGAEASEIGEDTISGQVASLEAFAAFQDAIRTTGQDFNTISDNTNLASPEFNANQEAFHRVLVELESFSDTFAELLVQSRPDLDTIMVQGDNVVRVLNSHQEEISQVVAGLANYVQTFAEGAGPERLPDGSGMAFFRIFLYMDGLEDALCSELAHAPPEFQPLRDAILGFQHEFDCSEHFSASAPAAAPGGEAMSPDQLAAAQQEVFNAYYGAVAQPDQPTRQSVGALVENLQAAGGTP
jgi:ABC-type transporter Mla subunit MlaD